MTQPLDLKLRPGETLAQRAEILGITRNQLRVLRHSAGLTVPVADAKKPDPAEDRRIAADYVALDVPVLHEAARRLGLGIGRLTGALERTRTARTVAPVVHVRAPVSRGWEPLPAGHAETWDILGWGKWPGSVG